MIALKVVLLAVAVAGAVARPWRIPAWVVPALAASVALAGGLVGLGTAHDAVRPLQGALAFLLAAVPLAILLDGLGFFESLAHLVSGGRALVPGLWLLAAAVTIVLNLDAAVVLLTPLYIRVARRTGVSVVALAFQPVILACLASGVLPVSNLTNLIASGRTGVGPGQFLLHLGPPSAAAIAVGYWFYRRAFPELGAARFPRERAGPVDRRALAVGGSVVALVLAGFLAGPTVGISPWEVALAADVALVAATRRFPFGAVPWGTALVAASLAVLAEAIAAGLPVAQATQGHGSWAVVRTGLLAAVAANLINNLPALLIALPALAHQPPSQLWAVLAGVDMGPTVLVTGSLAALLWLDASNRLGVSVTARDYARSGLRIGVPSLLAALGVLSFTARL